MLVEHRASSGARVLDIYLPGWEKRIDLGVLNLWNPYTCILGQLFGHFMEGLDILNANSKATELGFVPQFGESETELNHAWADEIGRRMETTNV